MPFIDINNDLLLRTYEVEDASALFAVIHNNREHLRTWLVWVDSTQSIKDTEQFILDSLYQLESQEGIAMGIFYKGKLIGGIGMLNRNHQLKQAHIGYWLHKDFEGEGLMSLSAAHFISYVFKELDLNKIEIRFLTDNKRSAALANRLHAKVEGVLRDSYLQNGVFADIVVTGILKREWEVGNN
jgi:ribosomal-protein-serine acetyltransferase